MPIINAFSRVNLLVKSPYTQALAGAVEANPGYDWQFDLKLPYDHLAVFARHIDTAAPVTKLPVFALVEFTAVAGGAPIGRQTRWPVYPATLNKS
jgi:hypothetical protein